MENFNSSVLWWSFGSLFASVVMEKTTVVLMLLLQVGKASVSPSVSNRTTPHWAVTNE